MDNYFDKALHHLGKIQKDTLALNIGSMDGVMFDEMIGYTNMYNYKVLYVEPIPYLFEKLKTNITGNALFENSAISDYNGEIEMITIDQAVIDSGLVHPCFYGMSAVYPPKNGLGSEGDRQTVEKYGKLVKVYCITFETLMQRHNILNFDIIKVDAEGHDYKIFKQIDLTKYKPKIIRLEWINLEKEEQENIIKILNSFNYEYEISGQDIVGIKKDLYDELSLIYDTPTITNKPETLSRDHMVESFANRLIEMKNRNKINDITIPKKSKVTIVTGLWDLGRGDLTEGWSRSYEYYLEKFTELLKIEENLIIFGDAKLKEFVDAHRSPANTQFIERSLDWFKNNDYFNLIQNIRTSRDWYEQVGWLSESTQAKLEYYNPLVMSKMFLLNDAKCMDAFDSEYLFWVDAGLANTVHPGYFTHDKVLAKLPAYFHKFSFICFPYATESEIHGFKHDKMTEILGTKVDMVARGGFFGGPKATISDINNLYYNLLLRTLQEGYMGTEESLFTILTYAHSDIINYFDIESNGLISTFFENLKDDTLVVKTKNTAGAIATHNSLNVNSASLYVLTFNSPNQFRTLIRSMAEYDENFLSHPKKFLLDNSTNPETFEEYRSLCDEHGFEHIKKNNIGICGGRQFIAEHFAESDADYMFFFEDDMFFYPKSDFCKNGFKRFDKNLYTKSLEIAHKENLDFLKLNFTEFFGDNSSQWAWYNVPQHFREKHWPNKCKLPVSGLDPNSPKTAFNSIKSHANIPYALGEIYYCNWPQIVSKTGNKKMFIDTVFAHPFEQTWMSHMFQLTIAEELKSGILLMTPTEHDRFEHYAADLRREN